MSEANEPERLPVELEAYLRIEKLSQYALDSTSPDGQHKARLFRSMLDLGPEDAEELAEQLLMGVHSGTITGTRDSRWGYRYKIEIPVRGNNDKTANVETVWQVEADTSSLNFVTVRTIIKDR